MSKSGVPTATFSSNHHLFFRFSSTDKEYQQRRILDTKALLIIISTPPYNGSDTVWNSLRLAKIATGNDNKVQIFLINDGVDTGRKELKPPENYFNLSEMLNEVARGGAEIKYCKTCIDRCGVGEGEMIEGINPGTMSLLHDWIMTTDKVVTF